MKRGEIWWADLPKPIGRRPVLLISRDEAYKIRANVIVTPLTRTIRKFAVEVMVDKTDGVPVKSTINTDTILTIPKTLLNQYIATLQSSKLQLVEQAIKFSLGII